MDKQHFFHRGRLTIPINDYKEDLIFNVWTSISEDNFEIRMDAWEDPKRTENDPYFGWLQSIIPTYGDTINIKSIALENEVGLIPEIRITEDDHPLRVDQENGITYDQAQEIVNEILRRQHR